MLLMSGESSVYVWVDGEADHKWFLSSWGTSPLSPLSSYVTDGQVKLQFAVPTFLVHNLVSM